MSREDERMEREWSPLNASFLSFFQPCEMLQLPFPFSPTRCPPPPTMTRLLPPIPPSHTQTHSRSQTPHDHYLQKNAIERVVAPCYHRTQCAASRGFSSLAARFLAVACCVLNACVFFLGRGKTACENTVNQVCCSKQETATCTFFATRFYAPA